MPRIKPIESGSADGRTNELLEEARRAFGRTPNMIATMANSAATLDGYLGLKGALQKGALSQDLRELISLAAAEVNACKYCLAAHSAAGKMVGLGDSEILASRSGESIDEKTRAALKFVRHLLVERGWIGDADVADVRAAGYTDGEITEIVANVAMNIFANYLNHVAKTEVDFPVAPSLAIAQ
jgi:uncharacterized peroxidase-related enzyme